MSAKGGDNCRIAAKTIPTEKEGPELFNISVGSIQLSPLASVRVRWAVLVGDTDEKGSSFWCFASCVVLARASFDITRLAKTPFDTVLLVKALFDTIRLANLKTLFVIIRGW